MLSKVPSHLKWRYQKSQAKFQETIEATLPSTKQIGPTVNALGVKVAPIVSTNLACVFHAFHLLLLCLKNTRQVSRNNWVNLGLTPTTFTVVPICFVLGKVAPMVS